MFEKARIYYLVKNLNNLCKTLDEDYNINCGGCCFISYLIAKHLDLLDIKYSLCVLNEYKLNKAEISNEVQNKCRSSNDSVIGIDTCIHYYLKVPGIGNINKGGFKGYIIHSIPNITYKNIKWVYKQGCWNNRYDVSNNSEIKNIINHFFRPYENKVYFGKSI